ncbi:MAG TPA: amidohydrolase family protein [Burkholderiales bacterium]|jgi:cytosine/adenosine deaminase-related metal-dependent hydrolase
MNPMLIVRGARVLDPLAPEPRPQVRDIGISGDRIAAVEAKILVSAGARVVEARDMLAIPGLVSAHYHSHDTLLKGCFAPMPLEAWLLHAVPPNYPQRSREEVRARVLIGALEALKSGITTLQDMATVHPFDPGEVDTIAQAYDDIGIRCVFALQVGDVPGSRPLPFWDELIPPALRGGATVTVRRGGSARELIERIEGERQRHAGRHPRMTWALGPATPEICSEEYLGLLAELSERANLRVFCHVYESKGNTAIARNHYGSDGGSLIRHLARVGLLNERFTLAHGVWLQPAEIEQVARAGAHVALNPCSNLKTGSGIAPVRAYLEAGVKLALGTDNSSCSDAQNMFQAMKLFALFAGDGGQKAFAAATLGGARALGLGDDVGRIAPGRKADITLLSLRDPAFAPLNDAVRQLVYTEPGRSVRHVIVDGRLVIENGRATVLDEDALYADIERLMPALLRDLEEIRKRNERLMPYVEEAHRRTMALDLGLDRYRTH